MVVVAAIVLVVLVTHQQYLHDPEQEFPGLGIGHGRILVHGVKGCGGKER